MPTYEYECADCHVRFEKFQNISDPVLKTCGQCGGPVKRLLGTGVGIIMKHSGSAGTSRPADQLRPTCGRDVPCCGRDVPCDDRPCDG